MSLNCLLVNVTFFMSAQLYNLFLMFFVCTINDRLVWCWRRGIKIQYSYKFYLSLFLPLLLRFFLDLYWKTINFHRTRRSTSCPKRYLHFLFDFLLNKYKLLPEFKFMIIYFYLKIILSFLIVVFFYTYLNL